MDIYRKHQPTPYDAAGAFLPERAGWLVVPVSQNRDSDALARSNFAVALAMVGGESDTAEVHRFGHWACGWYELLLVSPGTAAAAAGQAVEDALESYPILSDDDFSNREYEEASETWAGATLADRLHYIRVSRGTSIFAIRRDDMPEDRDGSLFAAILGH